MIDVGNDELRKKGIFYLCCPCFIVYFFAICIVKEYLRTKKET